MLRRRDKAGRATFDFYPTDERMIAIARVDAGTIRRRAAVERHRAIVVAAREVSRRLGYRTKTIVLAADDLPRFAEAVHHRSCGGMLVLSGLNGDVLRHFRRSSFPCVYADAAGDGMEFRSVAPDYPQSVALAMGQLLAAGFHRPGLILDRDLSLLAREHLIDAYGCGWPTAGVAAPPPFLTPTLPFDLFDVWLRRHAFDSLLTTDYECTRRLTPENRHPILNLDLKLQDVGRRAVELLHEQAGIRWRARE